MRLSKPIHLPTHTMTETTSQAKLPGHAVPSPLVDFERVLSATAGLGLGEEVILEGVNPDSAEQALYSAEYAGTKKERSFQYFSSHHVIFFLLTPSLQLVLVTIQ